MLPAVESEGKANTLHSLIVRYWRGQDGEVRGELINPVTQRVLAFRSMAGLLEVLTQAVLETPQPTQEES